MGDLRWSWLATPYVACCAVFAAVALAAALIRGDRVLRVGVIGAGVTSIPWAFCQALAACTHDPVAATHLLRLGQGPVSLVGPCLMLVLLGASGQLERYRWVALLAGAIGAISLALAWATPWVAPGVQLLPSGMFYIEPGPLTGAHISQLVVWLVVGLMLVRRATPRAERRRMLQLVVGVLVAGAIGSIDTLLLYRVWGSYPIAWLPTMVAAGLGLHLTLRTDLLRPQGLDRAVAIELIAFAAAMAVIGALALFVGDSSPLGLALLASIVWAAATAIAWALVRDRPVRVASERALEQFVARIATVDDAALIAQRLAALWEKAIGIATRTTWWRDGEELIAIGRDATWRLAPEVVTWLVGHGEALAITDLATMKLGPLRGLVEELGTAHGASLLVPLVDRGELVGLVEADFANALRESERGLVAQSARAAARALTFVALARAAARERDTAREVEVADALRVQATASREAELGRWAVAVEYHTAPRTTGAGWSATELADGRLAVIVMDTDAHGVTAALATASITGAFAAATAARVVTLDELVTALGASVNGIDRGGERVAAFLAILDAQMGTIEWACAGHRGANLVGDEVSAIGGALRGASPLPAGALVVIASAGLRGSDDAAWEATLRETAAATGRLASALVEHAAKAGEPAEDLLAVVVRAR